MIATDRDFRDAGQSEDLNRSRAGRGRSVTKLTIDVISPAMNRSVSLQSAAMASAKSDRADSRQSRNDDRNVAVGGGPVSKLSDRSLSPALDRGVVQNRARVADTSRDVDRRASYAQVNGGQ